MQGPSQSTLGLRQQPWIPRANKSLNQDLLWLFRSKSDCTKAVVYGIGKSACERRRRREQRGTLRFDSAIGMPRPRAAPSICKQTPSPSAAQYSTTFDTKTVGRRRRFLPRRQESALLTQMCFCRSRFCLHMQSTPSSLFMSQTAQPSPAQTFRSHSHTQTP